DHERAGSWTAVDGPPALPPQRWSVAPGELRHLAPGAPGSWVASVGVGIVHASAPAPPRRTPAPLAALGRRVKESFDPSGRLAPGRDPARR
ncbi:MAG: hypothetical protein ACYCUG_05875, partial [Acidimicrobiales bacterium]